MVALHSVHASSDFQSSGWSLKFSRQFTSENTFRHRLIPIRPSATCWSPDGSREEVKLIEMSWIDEVNRVGNDQKKVEKEITEVKKIEEEN